MNIKKELFDTFWMGLVLTIISGIVLCCIASIGYDKAFDISFIKDVFGALVGVFAVYMAVHLFTDWKEQYNINLEKDDLKLFKTKLNALYIMTDYFEVHFHSLYDFILYNKNNNIPHYDFNLMLNRYPNDLEECHQKRRQFSDVVNEYNFYLSYYLLKRPEFDLEKEFNKINEYGDQVNRLLAHFSDNLPVYFYNDYQFFYQKHLILREMLAKQIVDLNELLEIKNPTSIKK